MLHGMLEAVDAKNVLWKCILSKMVFFIVGNKLSLKIINPQGGSNAIIRLLAAFDI